MKILLYQLILWLFFIDMIMGAKLDELDRFICTTFAIMAKDDLIIPPAPANQAIKVDNKEIFLPRDAVISTEIPLQGFTESNGINEDHIHLFLNCFFQGGMLFQRIAKVVTEQGNHLKISS